MRHLIFDTETTDLTINTLRPLDKQPYITEFAAILWNDNDDSEVEFERLFKPPVKITPGALRTSKITDDMVKDAPPFVNFAPAIRALLMQAEAMVAHNLSFDHQVLLYEFLRADTADVKWPFKQICTVEATEHLQGHRLKLGMLYRHLFNEDFHGAHRAMVDTRALLRCYKELIKRGEL